MLKKACDDGHIEGCLQLAVSLENRPGPEAEKENGMREALRLYRRVCLAGGGPSSRDTRACKGMERLEGLYPKKGILDSL
jgi:TPR repeat protein